MSAHVLLTDAPLDERAALAALETRAAGAIVTFVGRVRERSRGREVVKLEYEAYAPMAQDVFARIAADARTRFDVHDVVIHHRTGTLMVGDVSVVIAVSAPHRAAAFDACRFAIDRLKETAPIWKKEHSPDGAVWIEERP